MAGSASLDVVMQAGMMPTLEEIQIQAHVALIEKLSGSEQRYIQLVNSLQLIVFRVDLDGQLLFLNDAWRDLLGYCKDSSLGQSINTYMLSAETDGLLKLGNIIPVEGEAIHGLECRLKTADGQLKSFSYSAQYEPATATVSGSLDDITEQVMSRIARSELMEQKSRFFSGISHDLRTPINSTIVAAELIANNDTQDIVKYANAIKDSAGHLLSLIDEILDYSKLESHKITLDKKPINLRDVINKIVMIFAPLCEQKGLQLTLNVSQRVPLVIEADEKRLRQILNNLLSNATKFTEKGTISVDFDAVFDGGRAKISCSVQDSGIGIKESEMARLFAPYQQVDSSIQTKYGGTGLGLSLTRELLKLMDGEICVESESGLGSAFRFHFFARVCESSQELGSSIEKKITFLEKKNFEHLRILIVEDDITTQMLLERMLIKLHGVSKDNITLASCYYDLEYLPFDTRFDLVITDCNLPDGNGSDVIEKIKRMCLKFSFDEPYFVISTASKGEKEATIMKRSEANQKAIKPLTTEKLQTIMDNYCLYIEKR